MALSIVNQRMLELLDFVKSNKVNGVTSQKAFCDVIGTHSSNIKVIREGKQSFTHDQILRAVKAFDIDVNWIYGLTNTMFNDKRHSDPITLLYEALNLLRKKGRTG